MRFPENIYFGLIENISFSNNLYVLDKGINNDSVPVHSEAEGAVLSQCRTVQVREMCSVLGISKTKACDKSFNRSFGSVLCIIYIYIYICKLDNWLT